jgi:acetylornithine/succinyldiaminopimelate/putrescine aminotransferase
MRPIPISAAQHIAKTYGYDQVIVIGRAVGKGEHVTTYGRNKEHCAVAARIGNFLRYKIMGWQKGS